VVEAIEAIATKNGLGSGTEDVEAGTGWWRWRFERGPTLLLAWYHPDEGGRLVSVWR
jgi:hypothetical protein